MISQIIQLIREHPGWLRSSSASLSFMKTSTPASGTRANQGKVLLFVFEEGEIWPTLCVKTTRTYSTGEVIRENHINLKLLERGVSGSEHAQMFAKPLYLYDDGSTIFCVESVCPGIKFSAGAHDVEFVIKKYIAWQSHLAWETKTFQTLKQDIRLPALIQHGDMTPDNVLVSGEDIYLIDYDYAGVSQLPGFDLYNFISKNRMSLEAQHSYYKQYFPRYFESIGAEITSYEALFPFYQQEETNRKAEKL